MAVDDTRSISVVARPDTTNRNSFYPSNRPPLRPSPLIKLPIGAVEPGGWLKTQLECLADGMVGRLAEISPFLVPEGNAWLDAEGEGHSHFEELPYWLRGFGDLAYLLENSRLIKEATVWVDGMLASQQPDGWFGPRRNRKEPDCWPNMVALNCLQSFHEATCDARVIECMSEYFRWQRALPREKLLHDSWQKIRGGDNLESIYWLYNRTGESWLLDLANTVHEQTADWSAGLASPHGVDICQGFREPAQYSVQTGDPALLEATLDNYRTVMERFGQVPGGMFGADENGRDGFHDPRQAAEACSMVEFMRSFEMLLKITGDPIWADRCEEVAFNSLPAAMTADLKALHYLTAPNQLPLDGENKHPGVENRGCMFAYSPYRYRCCQHNIAQGWPGHAEELWLATPDRGLCASLFARSGVVARVGDGTMVRIDEETDYPFDDHVCFAFRGPRTVRFPLYLRVPGWCEDARVTVNGRLAATAPEPGRFVVIDQAWQDGDTVDLELPMRIRGKEWARNSGSVSVSRGPLTYSLKIDERTETFEGNEAWPNHERTDAPSTPEWPAHELYPVSPWNYALVLDPGRPEKDLEVVRKPGPLAAQPFTLEDAPVELRAKARRLPDWKMEGGLVGRVPRSPVQATEPVESVRLVPMGCARLRISAFPVGGDPRGSGRKQPSSSLEKEGCRQSKKGSGNDGSLVIVADLQNAAGVVRDETGEGGDAHQGRDLRQSELHGTVSVDVQEVDVIRGFGGRTATG